MAEVNRGRTSAKSVFIIGAKCIGQYGGYETFLDKLTEVHAGDSSIQYYIVTKMNGDGAMDETKLSGVSIVRKNEAGAVSSFRYHNANVVKLSVPQILLYLRIRDRRYPVIYLFHLLRHDIKRMHLMMLCKER